MVVIMLQSIIAAGYMGVGVLIDAVGNEITKSAIGKSFFTNRHKRIGLILVLILVIWGLNYVLFPLNEGNDLNGIQIVKPVGFLVCTLTGSILVMMISILLDNVNVGKF